MHKAVFLDRDGVINEVLSERVKFVNKPVDFHLLPRVGEAITILNQCGYKVFVVTNQGGIGLGYIKESMLIKIHEKMQQELATYNAIIDDIAYCPHKPQAGCPCRKPKPEMILRLAEKHQVNLTESYMVGDRKPDIEAGQRAGVTTILVGKRNEQTTPDKTFEDLFTFATWLGEIEAN